MATTAYIGLGSNLGDKKTNIKKALKLLDTAPGLRVKKVASLYRTAPVGNTRQDWFINTVAGVETNLNPRQLLAFLLDVEAGLGRVRSVRWGPRTIDLDLLVFGQEEIRAPGLIVPHPRMCDRAFVMTPLAEIAPGLIIPGRGKVEGLARLTDKQHVVKMASR